MNEPFSDLEARLQAIIDTANDGIITIDKRGTIESINPAGSKLFGYAPDEVLGKSINMLMPSPYKENHDSYIDNYLTTRVPKIIGIGREVLGLKKDKTTFPFRLSVSEVILKDKVLFTGFIHDLTLVKSAELKILKLNEELEQKVEERTKELEQTVNQLLHTNKLLKFEVNERKIAESKLKEREAELENALEKEKELNELKSRFVSIASHEFRTPLSTVLSSANLIARYEKSGEQQHRKKHVDRIRQAVGNLTSTLNDFLSLSRLEEGKHDIHLDKLSLADLCNEVISEMQPLLKKEQSLGIEIIGFPNDIISDSQLIMNILFNLLSNAKKYSKEGTNIIVKINYDKNPLEVSVSDEGMGIPENEAKYLFTRFFRASNALNIEGTGLGLHIVRHYLQILEGEIKYQKLDRGSRFTFTLPKLAVDEENPCD